MIYSFGDIIRKVRPTVAEIATLPDTLHKNNLGQVVETFASGSIPVRDQTGSIVYSRSSKRFPKRSNLCVHSRWERTKLTIPPEKITALDLNPAHAGYTWESWWDHGEAYAAHVAAVTVANLQFPSRGLGKLQGSWLDYAASGFQSLQPDLTTTSVPNFLIDADQLLDLWSDIRLLKRYAVPNLKDTVTATSTMRATISNIKRALAGDVSAAKALGVSSKDLAKFVAGKRLSYKFGWTPTIGDVAAIFNSVLGTRAKLNAFKSSIGKELSYTKTLENTDLAKSGTFLHNNSIYYRVEWRGYLTGKVQYHCRYIPRPLAVTGELDENIRGLMDTLGVELDPRIAWDAIPFSFVLDWFLGVGDYLHQFRFDALQLPIDLVDSSVSYKEDYTVGSAVTINPDGYPTDSSSTTKPSGYVERSRLYHRMPVDPSLTLCKSLKWKNPTGSQWTNFVALGTVLGL